MDEEKKPAKKKPVLQINVYDDGIASFYVKLPDGRTLKAGMFNVNSGSGVYETFNRVTFDGISFAGFSFNVH